MFCYRRADLQVYRYLADGTPDATFGTAGESIFDVFATDHPRVIREHPDGGYLVLSESDNGGDWDMYVTRITSSGAIDASYATSGSHQIDASLSGGTFATADTLADGSIVVATRSDGPDAIRVTKLTPAGALDAGFAGGGETLVPFVLASGEVPRGIDVHHDGSIAIVGNMSSARSIILKLDANGVKDAGFGTGGEIYNLAMSNDEARSVLFEPDGDLLVGGRFNSGGGLDYEAYLARFDEAGNFDVSFGGTGMVTFPGVAGNDMIDRDELITLGADGTIYVAASTNAEADLTIFAFGGLPVPDYANGADDWDTAAPNDMMFGACLFSLAGTGSPAAAAPWAATGSCNATDADPWQQISVDAGGGNAKVAEETSSGSTDASINLRFGIRVADDQPPGSYAAPITFEAVAPNV